MSAVAPEAGSSRDAYFVDAMDVAAIFVTAGVLVTSALGVGGPLGILLALAFVTFVPGWALLDWIPVGEGISRVAIAVALSLTVCTAAAQGVLWLHLWHPLVLLYVLAPVSLVALLAHAVIAGGIFLDRGPG